MKNSTKLKLKLAGYAVTALGAVAFVMTAAKPVFDQLEDLAGKKWM